MNRTRAWLGAAAVALCGAAVFAQQPFTVERAEDWEALFWRQTGWTGADGIYSIPLDGYDQPGGHEGSDTLFVFSDTFIGEVGPNGERLGGWSLVNNTLALLEAGPADPEAVRFHWAVGDNGRPAAVFEPETPNSEPDNWYWLMDGTALGDRVHLFALRMKPGNGGPFNFAVAGIARISFQTGDFRARDFQARDFQARDPMPLAEVEQVDAPLFVAEQGERAERFFGAAILVNTEAAGSPAADGYVYVYGEESKLSKRMLAARVPANSFEQFSAWRFWDGSGWSTRIEDAAEVTRGISAEFSVSVLSDGRFLVAYQNLGLGREVAVRIGDSPVGPFSEPAFVWIAPEPDFDPDVFVYNAKMHPHLSAPGELLISYNVNSFSFVDNLDHAGLYRPRFIRVRAAP